MRVMKGGAEEWFSYNAEVEGPIIGEQEEKGATRSAGCMIKLEICKPISMNTVTE